MFVLHRERSALRCLFPGRLRLAGLDDKTCRSQQREAGRGPSRWLHFQWKGHGREGGGRLGANETEHQMRFGHKSRPIAPWVVHAASVPSFLFWRLCGEPLPPEQMSSSRPATTVAMRACHDVPEALVVVIVL